MAEKGRKILVAVDEGDESAYALSWCLKNLITDNNYKDTLFLLYAKQTQAVAMDSTGYLFCSDILVTMERHCNQVAQNVMRKASMICKDFNHQVRVEMVLEHGDPRDVICEVAGKLKVDFVVMGSHGYGVVKRAFLGSVSNHCAQKLKCPVVVVKKPTKSNDTHN